MGGSRNDRSLKVLKSNPQTMRMQHALGLTFYDPLAASQSARPICAWSWHPVIVMPDCSQVVTTLSKQTWPSHRRATRVTSSRVRNCPVDFIVQRLCLFELITILMT
jgi:hypothetical protein